MHIIMRFPEGKKKAVTLSYDDGVAQDIRLIEIMKMNGLKGTFNINTERFAEKDAETGKGKMSAKQCVELYKGAGMEVAVHTSTHPRLETMDTAHICKEVLDDRRELERLFGGSVRGMAYPYGTYNDKVVDVLRACGVAYSRTVESTHNFEVPTDWLRMSTTCRHADPELMNLAKKFIDMDVIWWQTSKLFYLWGHSYEFDTDNNWDVIEKFSELVGNREDIWYATNIEIYDYTKAYESLRFNIDRTYVENPTATDVWISVDQEIYKVPAGGNIKF